MALGAEKFRSGCLRGWILFEASVPRQTLGEREEVLVSSGFYKNTKAIVGVNTHDPDLITHQWSLKRYHSRDYGFHA